MERWMDDLSRVARGKGDDCDFAWARLQPVCEALDALEAAGHDVLALLAGWHRGAALLQRLDAEWHEKQWNCSNISGVIANLVVAARPLLAKAEAKLEPCPACKSAMEIADDASLIANRARCTNGDCEVIGPVNDPDGSKWNAMCRGLRGESEAVTYSRCLGLGYLPDSSRCPECNDVPAAEEALRECRREAEQPSDAGPEALRWVGRKVGIINDKAGIGEHGIEAEFLADVHGCSQLWPIHAVLQPGELSVLCTEQVAESVVALPAMLEAIKMQAEEDAACAVGDTVRGWQLGKQVREYLRLAAKQIDEAKGGAK